MSLMIRNKYTYHVNSLLRSSGDNNYDFRIQTNLPPQADVDSICLIDCQIPKSYYVVQDGFNTFTLIEDGTPITVTMSVGNYNRKNFGGILASTLTAASLNGVSYTISYDSSSVPDTGKYYYTLDSDVIAVSFRFSTINTLWQQMGFDAYSTNTFVGTDLTSTNVINLQSENSIFLLCDAINNNEGDTTLAILYGSSNSDFSFISFQVTDVQAYMRKLVSVTNEIGFKLQDENGLPVKLNGVNITFTFIVFKAVYVLDRLERFFDGYSKAFDTLLSLMEKQTQTPQEPPTEQTPEGDKPIEQPTAEGQQQVAQEETIAQNPDQVISDWRSRV